MNEAERDITKSDAFISSEDVFRAVGSRQLLARDKQFAVAAVVAHFSGVRVDEIRAFTVEESPLYYGLIIRRLRVRRREPTP